jgi:hypothetical protein
MNRRIPLQTNERKFFRQVLELLNPLLKLRHKELDVLAELMYKNNVLRTIPVEHRWKLILDSASRKEMKESAKQSTASFNNNIAILKKKKHITEKGIKPFLDFPYDPSFTLTFEFKADDRI